MNRTFSEARSAISLVLGLLLISIATFCSRIELVNKASIAIHTDWSKRGHGIDIPVENWLVIEGKSYLFNGGSIVLPEYFPGIYKFSIYNKQNDVLVSNNIATVSSVDGVLNSKPTWFFSHHSAIEYNNDVVINQSVEMQQQIRELRILLNPKGGSVDDIQQVEATLSGIAESWDLLSNTSVGKPLDVVLPFEKQIDGSWLAVVRLIGVIGSSQIMSGKVTFQNNMPTEMMFMTDISTDLVDFNSDKSQVMSFSGLLDTPTAAGFEASIVDWVRVIEDGTAW